MSGNAVATKENTNISTVTDDKIKEYMETFGIARDLNSQEQKQFMDIAREYQLNPFKREIHVAAYGQGEYRTLAIVVGYEVYIKRANRTGKLDGWRAWTENRETESGKKELVGIVEINRKDWNKPFIHEVYFEEVKQTKRDGAPNAFWKKQPRFQLKKVAISQGFRLCFPDELEGLPYSEEELTNDISTRNVSPQPEEQPEETELQSDKALEDMRRVLSAAVKEGLITKDDQDKTIEQVNRGIEKTKHDYPMNWDRFATKQILNHTEKIRNNLDVKRQEEERRAQDLEHDGTEGQEKNEQDQKPNDEQIDPATTNENGEKELF